MRFAENGEDTSRDEMGSEELAFSEQRQSAALRFIACAKRRAFVATPCSPYIAARVQSLPKRRCLQHARTLAHQFVCTSAEMGILLPSHLADHVVPAISVLPPLYESAAFIIRRTTMHGGREQPVLHFTCCGRRQ